MFAAGAGHIGDYSHCSWAVTGTGQFLPHEGASPSIGSVGTVERVAEDRVEIIAPARLRRQVLAAMRAPTRTRSRPSTSSHWRRCPPISGLGRIGDVGRPGDRWRPSSSRVHDALPATSWGVRAAGDAGAQVSRVAVCGGAGDSLFDVVAGAGVARLCDGRPATPSRRRTPAGIRRRPGRRRALGQRISRGAIRRRSCCAASSARRCRCGCPPSAPIRGTWRELSHES